MSESKPKQTYTEAKKRANQKWDSANLDRISVVVPKGKKDEIKTHAANMGESINQYINRAIENQMKKDESK